MASVCDVATYVLDKQGSVSTMKLQKLVFYSQALHLVQHGTPLFNDRIEAWANGPVVPSLFSKHRGKFVISRGFFGPLRSCALSSEEVAPIDRVLRILGPWTGADLSALTHGEEPWRAAREGLAPTAPSKNEISQESIRTFYGSPRCTNPIFA